MSGGFSYIPQHFGAAILVNEDFVKEQHGNGFFLYVVGSFPRLRQIDSRESLGIVPLKQLNLFRQHGLHLFGSYIEFRSTILARTLNLPAVVLDSAYLSLLLNHGLIPSILFVIAIVRISMVFSKTKNYLLLIMMALFMLGGMMEQYVLHVQTNFTLLALTSYVSPSVLAPNPLSSTQKKRRRNKIQI